MLLGMQGGARTTVALISQHHLLRLGLQQVLKSEGWIRFDQPTVAGMNTDELILQQSPDIIIIDSEIARDVSPVISRIKASHTQIKLILLCSMDEAEHSRQRLSLGIDAIVLKVQPAQILVATIKHLMNIPELPTQQSGTSCRKVGMEKGPVAMVPSSVQSQEGQQPKLSERERQIVKLVAEGLSNKEIAACMYLADTTVRHHLTKIFDKLGVSNRQNLLIRAHQHGIE